MVRSLTPTTPTASPRARSSPVVAQYDMFAPAAATVRLCESLWQISSNIETEIRRRSQTLVVVTEPRRKTLNNHHKVSTIKSINARFKPEIQASREPADVWLTRDELRPQARHIHSISRTRNRKHTKAQSAISRRVRPPLARHCSGAADTVLCSTAVSQSGAAVAV